MVKKETWPFSEAYVEAIQCEPPMQTNNLESIVAKVLMKVRVFLADQAQKECRKSSRWLKAAILECGDDSSVGKVLLGTMEDAR